jgi:hypothetical protein
MRRKRKDYEPRIKYQMQAKLFRASVQVAPFLQGLEAHSTISVWHRTPANPGELSEKNKTIEREKKKGTGRKWETRLP